VRNKTSRLFLTVLIAVYIATTCFSCKNKQNLDQLLYPLSPKTFSDELVVEGTVEAVRSTVLFCPGQVDGTIIFIIDDGSIVETGDTLCILENRELSSNYEQLLQQLEQTNAEYAKSEANLNLQYSLLEAQVKNNEAQTSITNLDSAQLQYASLVQQKITKLQLKRAMIEKNRYEKKLELLKTINEFELKKLRLQITRVKNRANNVKSQLEGLYIKAPHAGLALRSRSPFSGEKLVEGDNVWPGISVVLMPDQTQMKVVMNVSESDYKRIKINDRIRYSFSSNPSNSANGKITIKAPIGIPVKRESKVKFFEITASVDSFQVIPEPGISAGCTVVLTEIPDTIVVPQLAIFEDDSIKVVYVSDHRKFEKREVLLGENTPKEAVIIAGLKGNEILSLIPPSDSRISATRLLPDSVKSRLMKTPDLPVTDTVSNKKTVVLSYRK
jgi:multidrug efflux pump subunit AcrA (membrane-fusion protein)